MRKLLTVLCLSGALFIGAPGCATKSPQTVSGQVIVSTQQTVDAALKGFARWVKAKEGTPTPVSQDTLNKVNAANVKYTAALNLARTAWVAGASSTSTATLDTSMAILAGCRAELLTLIETLTK